MPFNLRLYVIYMNFKKCPRYNRSVMKSWKTGNANRGNSIFKHALREKCWKSSSKFWRKNFKNTENGEIRVNLKGILPYLS